MASHWRNTAHKTCKNSFVCILCVCAFAECFIKRSAMSQCSENISFRFLATGCPAALSTLEVQLVQVLQEGPTSTYSTIPLHPSWEPPTTILRRYNCPGALSTLELQLVQVFQEAPTSTVLSLPLHPSY